jgi:hypothetical protein
MPINPEINDLNGSTLHVRVMDCLHKRGYERFVESIEALIKQQGKIRILFDMTGFHGWKKGIPWFNIGKSFPAVEYVAFVGDRKWENNIGMLCKQFPLAELRYFERGKRALALEWMNTQASAPTPPVFLSASRKEPSPRSKVGMPEPIAMEQTRAGQR